MRVLAVLFIVALLAAFASAQQSFCAKYAIALNVTQEELMNTTITAIALRVATCSNCPTAAWFNGSNGVVGKDFVNNPMFLNGLIAGLMAFFGNALKCDDPAFIAKFGTGVTDVNAVHKPFQKLVNKAAFEYFNQAVIDVLAQAGVVNADLQTVAQFLDSFRAEGTGAKPADVVCQDADCTSSPFGVKVQPTYFNPSYMTVPHGTVVSFFKDDLSPHIISESAGNGTNVCEQANPRVIELDLTGNSGVQRTDPLTRELDYFDVVNCNSQFEMTGVIIVKDSAASLSFCLSMVVLLAALLSML